MGTKSRKNTPSGKRRAAKTTERAQPGAPAVAKRKATGQPKALNLEVVVMRESARGILRILAEKYERARATLYVTAAALDAGESDLELLSATTVKGVARELQLILDNLTAMGVFEKATVEAAT